jgi:hypothetical protein
MPAAWPAASHSTQYTQQSSAEMAPQRKGAYTGREQGGSRRQEAGSTRCRRVRSSDGATSSASNSTSSSRHCGTRQLSTRQHHFHKPIGKAPLACGHMHIHLFLWQQWQAPLKPPDRLLTQLLPAHTLKSQQFISSRSGSHCCGAHLRQAGHGVEHEQAVRCSRAAVGARRRQPQQQPQPRLQHRQRRRRAALVLQGGMQHASVG